MTGNQYTQVTKKEPKKMYIFFFFVYLTGLIWISTYNVFYVLLPRTLSTLFSFALAICYYYTWNPLLKALNNNHFGVPSITLRPCNITYRYLVKIGANIPLLFFTGNRHLKSTSTQKKTKIKGRRKSQEN